MPPNHGWDTLGSILGPMWSHWVQKMGHNPKKLPCSKIRIFDEPAVIDCSKKMEVTVIAPIHSGDPLGSIFGPMGSHWVKKMGQKRKKLPCPKIRIFDYPAVIDFSQKLEVTVMAPNQGGDPLVSILGPMGSHWVKKIVQNHKKLPCPKIWIFIDFLRKMEATVMAPNHGGATLGAILELMGSHWVQKMGQNVENCNARNSNVRRPRGHRFFPKNGSYGYSAKSWGGPLGSIFGPMGSHWVEKMGQKRKKLPCHKIRIFDYPAVIDFSQKMEVIVMAANHGGDPRRVHLEPMGSHWVEKMGQNRKKLPCHKIRIFN